jgi:hypothetical protein
VLGIGTILQCYVGKYIGSGFLLPFNFTAAYLPGSLAAAELGGMPLVFRMTLFGGAIEIALAWVVPRLRRRDVMARAIFGTAQTLEVVFDQDQESRPVVVEAVFDEYNLD